METKKTAFSAAIPVPELLDKHNYLEWKIRVRTYLKGQDLWKVIIDKDEKAPAYENDDVDDDAADDDVAAAAINVRRRLNYMALHVIQISCGPDAFSEIRTVYSAKTAWQTLEKKYLVLPDTSSSDNSYLQYADLYMAVRRGHLNAARNFLDSFPRAVNKAITYKGETALHIAATAGRGLIVRELAARMSEEDLGIEDCDGYTALMTALVYGRSELAHYLYFLTSLDDNLVLAEKGRKGAMLLTRAIYTRNLVLALDLIRHYPRLTHALDDRGESPLLALASMRHLFPSGNRLGFWKQWIYDHLVLDLSDCHGLKTCWPFLLKDIRIDQPDPSNVENGLQRNQLVTTIESVLAVRLRYLVSIVGNLLGIDQQLYERKKNHIQSVKLLKLMCEEISRSFIQTGDQHENIGGVYDAIDRAVKNGIIEFVFEMILGTDKSFLENKYRNSRNMLMLAVLYRQSEIFNLIHELDMDDTLTSYGDCNDDNILHMVGMIEVDSTRLNQISGAALQMQRELQWFKDVERIVNPEIKEGTNRDGLTPRDMFTKNHENMMEKGEKWMKDTASSCTVVGTLIVTIMFAVAFTVPGGNDQTRGFPIFLDKKLFVVFIISDALSLFSSTTSVLMFLGILTSRYAEEDFFESLPRKLIIGLSTLFLSIATMMIAFCASLLIMLHDQYSWIAIPIICLASVPVTLFISMQSPLLFKMIMSTYFPSIIKRKKKYLF